MSWGSKFSWEWGWWKLSILRRKGGKKGWSMFGSCASSPCGYVIQQANDPMISAILISKAKAMEFLIRQHYSFFFLIVTCTLFASFHFYSPNSKTSSNLDKLINQGWSTTPSRKVWGWEMLPKACLLFHIGPHSGQNCICCWPWKVVIGFNCTVFLWAVLSIAWD